MDRYSDRPIVVDEQASMKWIEHPDHPGFGERVMVAKDGREVTSYPKLMRADSARRTAEAKGLPFEEVAL